MKAENLKKLKILREETGVSYKICKKALEEAKYDLEKARKVLVAQGAERIKKKGGKKTKEGFIFCYVHHTGKIAAMVELLCQTDFVAKNAEFQKLGKELAMQAAFSSSVTDKEKFLKESYIRDQSKKVEDLIKEAILKLGENIKLSRFIRWEIGE